MSYEPQNKFEQLVIDKLGTIENLNIKQNGSIKDNIKRISFIEAWKNKILGGLIITDIILVPVILALIFTAIN